MKLVVGPLQKREPKWFIVRNAKLTKWTSVPSIVLYSCDSLKVKYMSAVRHVAALKRTCSRCLEPGVDTISGRTSGRMSLREKKMIGRSLLEILRISIATVVNEKEVVQEKERAVSSR